MRIKLVMEFMKEEKRAFLYLSQAGHSKNLCCHKQLFNPTFYIPHPLFEKRVEEGSRGREKVGVDVEYKRSEISAISCLGGTPPTCNPSQVSTCPAGYDCSQSTTPSTFVCCLSGSSPGGGSQGCPIGWNPFVDNSNIPRTCSAITDTS